jgi:hypothetical protein
MWSWFQSIVRHPNGQLRSGFWLALGLVLLLVIGFVWQSWEPA